MGESSATSRVSSGADEFDRRMRSLDQSAPQRDDPLAELARLVGQEDPFRGIVPAHRFAPPRPLVTAVRPAETITFDDDAGSPNAGISAHDDGASGSPDDPAVAASATDRTASPQREQVLHAPVTVHAMRPVEPSPDAWARGDEVRAAPSPAIGPLTATRDEPLPEPSAGSSKRTLIVLAAVIILTGGGLGASFLVRPSGGMAASAPGATPTIMAATGPSKVQPETATTDLNAPSEPSTLLDKNKGDGTATAKVVDSVEQPVDLAQATKLPESAPAATGLTAPQSAPTPIVVETPVAAEQAAAVAPASPDVEAPSAAAPLAGSSSPFPEPRKVKTVLIRPDGSVIAEAPSADGSGAGITQQANLAFDPRSSLTAGQPASTDAPSSDSVSRNQASAPPISSAPPPAAAIAPVKTQARVGTTPKSTPAGARPDGVAAAQSRTPASMPKPKPLAAVKPKPVVQADATPTAVTPPAADVAATPGSGGNFAVQLGAPPSETEAKDLSSRLIRKYAAQLGSHRPVIHVAQASGKTVYRIRVGNLSQEDAKTLCSDLQSGGGGCFVVRN